MWRLIFPLKYFSLHNKEKSRIDLWPTLILACVISCPYILFEKANFFLNAGFLDKIIPLSSALTAFYVAALVAVATFSHPDLDKEITLGAIYLKDKDAHGNPTKDFLTRRQFACVIFGYLSFISMIISVGSAIAVTISGIIPNDFYITIQEIVISISSNRISKILNTFWIVVFSLGISHMMIVTALGLYYLMDRIHDREPKIITKKKDVVG